MGGGRITNCFELLESLLLIIALTSSNADIQKLLAFEGAFDRLFAIVNKEGGIGGGGIVVQDCLAAIGGLLRWNVSNQVSFLRIIPFERIAKLLVYVELLQRNFLYPTSSSPSSLPSTSSFNPFLPFYLCLPILVRTKSYQRWFSDFFSKNVSRRSRNG